MCGLFPCIPILGVFIFNKKVSWDEGFRFLPCFLSWVAAYISRAVWRKSSMQVCFNSLRYKFCIDILFRIKGKCITTNKKEISRIRYRKSRLEKRMHGNHQKGNFAAFWKLIQGLNNKNGRRTMKILKRRWRAVTESVLQKKE